MAAKGGFDATTDGQSGPRGAAAERRNDRRGAGRRENRSANGVGRAHAANGQSARDIAEDRWGYRHSDAAANRIQPCQLLAQGVSHRAAGASKPIKMPGGARAIRETSRAPWAHKTRAAALTRGLEIRLDAKYPFARLPVVADLAAADHAVEAEAGVGRNQHAPGGTPPGSFNVSTVSERPQL